MVLRGIFTLRRSELEWFYQVGSGGVENCFPESMETLCKPIPPAEHGDIMGAYYRRLTGPDEDVKLHCARAWSTFEMSTSKLFVDPEYLARGEDDQFAVAFARIETHYFVHGGFFKYDGQLVKEANILEEHSIPGIIVQGRYDMVCPMKTAYDLKANWPSSELIVVPDAGHSAGEIGTTSELCNATDKMAKILQT